MIHGETATSVFKGHRLIEVCFISACSRISRGMGGVSRNVSEKIERINLFNSRSQPPSEKLLRAVCRSFCIDGIEATRYRLMVNVLAVVS